MTSPENFFFIFEKYYVCVLVEVERLDFFPSAAPSSTFQEDELECQLTLILRNKHSRWLLTTTVIIFNLVFSPLSFLFIFTYLRI